MEISEAHTQGESYVIGVDGGQTGSRAILSTSRGRILASSKGGPVLHFASQKSRSVFADSITGLLSNLWSKSDLDADCLSAVCLGLTGVTAGSLEASTAKELTISLTDVQEIWVYSDAFTALKGAHAGKPGVMIIAGTGMVAMGVDMHARVARSGGWGWALGDDGSAFAIGRDALRAVMNAHDGTDSPTLLTDLFMEHFQVQRVPDIKRIYMDSNFGARAFGQLAGMVSKAAQAEDPVALRIIGDNAAALVRCAQAVIRKLDFGAQPVPVAAVGGAFEYIYGLKQNFVNEISSQGSVQVVDAEFPPVIGALIVALESCGQPFDQVVTNLRQTFDPQRLAL